MCGFNPVMESLMPTLRNVIFDVGNVLVRWSPAEIINLTFANPSQTDVWIHNIFKHETWQSLNLGLMTEAEAQTRYQSLYGLTPSQNRSDEDQCGVRSGIASEQAEHAILPYLPYE